MEGTQETNSTRKVFLLRIEHAAIIIALFKKLLSEYNRLRQQ